MKKKIYKQFSLLGRIMPAAALLLVASNITNPLHAQNYERVYANGSTNGGFLSTISNAALARDGDLTTASTINFTLAGSSYQQFTFAESPGTNKVHVKFSLQNAVGLLPTIDVAAYNGSTEVSSVSSTSLLSLLAGEKVLDIVVTPSSAITSVRITYTGVALGGGVKVYEAYFDKPTVADINCDAVADVLAYVGGDIAGGLSAIIGSTSNVADGDDETYTQLTQLASAAGKTTLTALYNSYSQPGDLVRIAYSSSASIIDVGLISNHLSVNTLNDNASAESNLVSDASLLRLKLLSPTTGIVEALIPTTVPFNRIEAGLTGLLTLLPNLRIHEIERYIPEPGVDVADTVFIYGGAGITKTITATPISASDDVAWYDNEDATGIPAQIGGAYTVGNSASKYYSVVATRDGCNEKSLVRKIYVKVLPVVVEHPAPEMVEGTPYSYQIVTTVDGDDLTDGIYALNTTIPTIVGFPTSLSLSPSGLVTGTPVLNPAMDLSHDFYVDIEDNTGDPIVIGEPFVLEFDAPLPIYFNYFNAENVQGMNMLNWSVNHSVNQYTFEIQRGNADLKFTKIGSILAKDQESKYQFEDRTFTENNNFYRIVAVDENGKKVSSQVVKVNAQLSNQNVVSVYPNPSEGQINVKLQNPELYKTIIVHDVTGRMIQYERVSNSITQLNLKPGAYFVSITDESNFVVYKSKVTVK